MQEAQNKFEKAMTQLAKKQEQLAEVRAKLNKLKIKLDQNEKLKVDLEAQVQVLHLYHQRNWFYCPNHVLLLLLL